jgi:membrane-associated PAP2 superfamily phosphatase
MNRTGLSITLAIAVVVGVIFAVRPQLDLNISRMFFDKATHGFDANGADWAEFLRNAARVIIGLLVAPAILALVGKVLLPGRRMLIDGRVALLLTVTLALGPGVIANTLLKDHWGRTRPEDVAAFGGAGHFTPWWDPRGDCSNNCSFIAGEPAGAFWVLAPVSVLAPQWRLLGYAGVLAFGTAVGVLRMAAGAHFFTDVVFAGVIMFLVVWVVQGLIYRWRPTRLADGAVEGALLNAAKAVRGAFAALARRRGRATDKSP